MPYLLTHECRKIDRVGGTCWSSDSDLVEDEEDVEEAEYEDSDLEDFRVEDTLLLLLVI